ncbi:MAG: Cna B-type domain-containing protein [Peptoniphilus sp.]|uniref:Cna B-type domain-containing protein n=1 Tax=Peptoniphilus sp. TaxID=1971214 RepID=UPI002A7573F4|nr:Cna B-type domain-containing protein [Peptoniphilus sp.]MDY2987705.1 Cna B-type domain-containing protein [Peptoniphilus sp.]
MKKKLEKKFILKNILSHRVIMFLLAITILFTSNSGPVMGSAIDDETNIKRTYESLPTSDISNMMNQTLNDKTELVNRDNNDDEVELREEKDKFLEDREELKVLENSIDNADIFVKYKTKKTVNNPELRVHKIDELDKSQIRDISNDERTKINYNQDGVLSSASFFTDKLSKFALIEIGSQDDVEMTTDRELRALPMMAQYISNDFTQYVRKVEVLTRRNQEWIPTDQVYEKDQVKVNIEYAIPNGFVSSENSTGTYQVPKSIKLEGTLEGTVKTLSGEDAGRYNISTDGFISITFDQEFLNKHKDHNGIVNGFDGTVQFLGIVSKNSVDNNDRITFPGSGTTVEILVPKERNTDISSKKKGELSPDKRKVTYTVDITTKKGTEKEIRVTDRIDWVVPSNLDYEFDLSTLRVEKNGNTTIYSDGHSYSTEINLLKQTNGYGKTIGFDLQKLPKLEANESYKVTYEVKINSTPKDISEIRLNNTAWTISGPDQHGTDDVIKWSKSVKKSGYFNPNGQGYGEVNWTITVNPDKKDLSSWRIRDQINHQIKDGSVRLIDLDSGDIIHLEQNELIKYSDGNWLIDFSFNNYKIKNRNSTYRLEYTTFVERGITEVTNKVEKYGNEYEEDTTTIKTTQDFALNKFAKVINLDDKKNRTKNRWQVGVNIGINNSNTFTFTDTFENLKKLPNGGSLGDDSHYAYASELDKELQSQLFFRSYGGEGYRYRGNDKDPEYSGEAENRAENRTVKSIKVTYYDSKGEAIPETDTTRKVKSFKVDINYESSFNPKDFAIGEYHTYSDLSEISKNEKIKIINKATVADKTTTAETEYEKRGKIEKGVLTGIENYIPIYKNGKSAVDYSKDKGQIEYRIMITTSEVDGNQTKNGTLVIDDILPDGAEYVEGSLEAAFFRADNLAYPKYDRSNRYGTNFQGNSKPTITINQEGNKKVATIKIDNYIYDDYFPIVQIFYKLDVSKDEFWKDNKNVNKTYINEVSWNSEKTSNEVTVEKKLDKLTKKGWQLDDKGQPIKINDSNKPIGNPTGNVKYNLVINPEGEDLIQNGNELTLVDKLKSQGKIPRFDIDKAKLYEYDNSKPDNKGREIEKGRYKITFDEEELKLTLIIPDELACVFEYIYEFTNFADSLTIKNEAELSGIASSKDTTILRDNQSSATVTVKEIKIYKVDSKDIKKFLPGTKFKLEKFDHSKWNDLNNAWHIVKYKDSDEITIPDSGYISWSLSGANPGLEADVLYRLTEIESLDGYTKLTEPVYFIWMKAGSDEYSSYHRSENRPDLSKVDKGKISFLKNSGGIMYIKNDYTKIRVNKFWQDDDGLEYESENIPNIEVRVDLYRKTGKDGNFEKLENHSKTLTKANKYTESWTGLPARDEQGAEYFYKVKEVEVNGYETYYFNNDGIQSGEINIFNKKIKSSEIELPVTGGIGTNRIYAMGTVLLFSSCIYMLYQRKRYKIKIQLMKGHKKWEN